MKIFITGSDGMLAWAIQKIFASDDLVLADKLSFDVTKQRVITENPDIIFHLAAETNLARAEEKPEHTYMVNHTGTANMVDHARRMNIPIVYISTAGIFDGTAKAYVEEAEPNPLNHYGRSKYYGEMAVKSYPKHFIIRCGWGMGGGPKKDKKFINAIYHKVLDGAKVIPSNNEVIGSPTYFIDLAMTLKNIIKSKYGIYNCASPDSASRAEIATEFVRLLGVDVKIIPMSDEEFSKNNPPEVNYPRREVLNTDKIQSTRLSCMRPWREALEEYIEYFINNQVPTTEREKNEN